MASVTKLDSDGRQGYRVRFYIGPRQREIYLAGLSRKTERLAGIVARYCDDLAQAKSNNVAPAADAVTWAAGTDGKLRENLIAWGLADPTSAKLTTDAGLLVGAFVTAYINGLHFRQKCEGWICGGGPYHEASARSSSNKGLIFKWFGSKPSSIENRSASIFARIERHRSA